MQFQYIDIVFNNSGNAVYVSLPDFINQYSTNYLIRVGFSGVVTTKRISASIRNIALLPERILFQSPTEAINANGVTIKPVYTYQLTQFDTYIYTSNLMITINCTAMDDTVFNYTANIPMQKSNYSKINPNLGEDSTLNSLIAEMDNIRKYINQAGAGVSSITPEPDTLVLRDNEGKSQINLPINNLDIANKEYVDLIGNKTIPHSIISTDEGFRVDYGNSELTIPVEGSEGVVIDINEADEKIEIHLDHDIFTKLAKTLIIPTARPSETSIVAINNTGSQDMLSLDELYGLLHPEQTITGISINNIDENSNKVYFNQAVRNMVDNAEKIEATIDALGNEVRLLVKVIGYQHNNGEIAFTGCAGDSTFLSCLYRDSEPSALIFTLSGVGAPPSYNLINFKIHYKA